MILLTFLVLGYLAYASFIIWGIVRYVRDSFND